MRSLRRAAGALVVVGALVVTSWVRAADGDAVVADPSLTWTPLAMREVGDVAAPLRRDAPLVMGVQRTLGPGAAAALWLDDGDVIRLSTTRPAALADLRARAVNDTPGGTTLVDVDLVARPADRLLLVPPGGAGWWLVDARVPSVVTLEKLTRRSGRLVWEHHLDEVRAWIERATHTPPPTPPTPAGDLTRRLVADAALAREVDALVGGVPEAATFAAATRAIRVASAQLAVLAARPALPAYVDSAPIAVPLADAELATPPEFTVEGPAVLAIDVTGVAGADLEVTVRSHGAVVARKSRAVPAGGRPAEAARATASLRVPIGYGRVSVTVAALGASHLTVTKRTARHRLRHWLRDRRVGADLRRACAAMTALPTRAATARARTSTSAACDSLLGVAPLLPATTPASLGAEPPPALVDATAAWRAVPAEPARRTAARDAWRAATWRALVPDREGPRDATSTWLVVTPSADADADATGRELWELPPGPTTSVLVLAGPQPQAPAVVTMRLLAARAGELATISIDGRAYPAIALGRVTPLRFAIAPGAHTMAVTSVANTRLLVEAAAVQRPGAMAPAATRQRYTPVPTSGDELGVELPHDAPALRLSVRRTADAAPGVARLTVHSTTGWQSTVELSTTSATGAVDDAAVPLDGAPAVGARSDVTLWPPAGVGRIWMTADVPSLLVSVAARRDPAGTTTPPRRTPPATPAATPSLPQLVALSAAVAATPRAIAPRLDRADLLLALGEASLARAELAGVLRLDPSADAERARVEDLLDRVAPNVSSSFLPLQPAGVEPVVPLAPALLAMPAASVAAIAPAVAALAGGARPATLAADDVDPARRWLAAYAARADADPTAMLFSVWPLLDASYWQAGLDALSWTPRTALAAATAEAQYAVARAVGDVVVHPLARARLALTGRHSRWATLRGADRSAGFVRIPIAPSAAADPNADAVRRALIGLPAAELERDDLEVLRADDVATLRYDSSVGGEVTVTARCAEPFATTASACRLAWRIDTGSWTDLPGATAGLAVPAGKHVVEVAPRDLGTTGMAIVGFAGSPSIAPPLTTRVDWATPSQPVELVVDGPALLRLDLRDDRATPATRVEVAVDGKAAAAVPLDATLDPTVTPFDLTVRTSTTLRLSSPGAHVVRIAVPRGRVAVRAVRRTGMDVAEPPGADLTLPPRAVAAVTPLVDALPRLPDGETAHAPAPGTAALDLTLGNQDATELADDEIDVAQHAAITLSLLTSRGTGRAALDLRTRAWDARPTSFGVRARARWLARPSLALALDVRGDASASADGMAWSGRANLAADYHRPLRRSLEVLLGGDVAARHYDAEHRGETLDARVYSAYGVDHPVSLQPRIGLRLSPLQDLQVRTVAEVHSNADLYTVDQLALSATVRGQLELGHLRGPVAQLQYAPTLRLTDDDRSMTTWRHAVRLGLEHFVWRARAGSLELSLDAAIFVEPGRDLGSSIQLGLRWVLTGGRGLRDLWPGDVFPIEYAEPRWWAAPR